MQRFYAPPSAIEGDSIRLDEPETRHLREVLRLRTGDAVRVFDGHGHEYSCLIAASRKKHTTLTVVEEVAATAPESPLDLALAAAILKGEKFDLVVQKAVELGVRNLSPLYTARCDVKRKGSSKRVDRWRRIALMAAKQSGRATLMEVTDPMDLEEFLSGREDPTETRIFFSERGGGKLIDKLPGPNASAIVGPEGGWDDQEIENARNTGCKVVTLGGRILRAETAAIAVAAILQHRFGDVN